MSEFIFDEIPADFRVPGVYLEAKPNYSTVGVQPYPVKNLIIGGILDTGTLEEGQVMMITNADDAVPLFGAGSTGAEMVKAFRKANSTQPLYVMGIRDGAQAVAAAGGITFSGGVSASSVIRLKIAGRKIKIAVTSADTAKTVSRKLTDELAKIGDLPLTASISEAGGITLTAKHKGEVGNDIDLRVDTGQGPLPAGFGIKIMPMTGGGGNPDINKALDAIRQSWFTAIAAPWSDRDNMAALALFLDDAYKALAKRDCKGYIAKRAGFSAAIADGDSVNCAFLAYLPVKNSPTSSWVLAGSAMGIAEFNLANDPARQLRGLVIPGVEAPDDADRWSLTEQDLLLRHGCSTLESTATGAVVMGRIITTYKMTSLNTPSAAWLDITVPSTVSRIRYDWGAFLSLNYPRAKLANDNSSAAFSVGDGGASGAVVTPGRIKASWAGRCALYADRAWIEDVDETIEKSEFQRSSDDKNRLNGRMVINIIGNAMIIAGSLEFMA